MKLWIDDVRPAPAGWTWVKTTNMATTYLGGNYSFAMAPDGTCVIVSDIKEISLDHDAGDYASYGGDYIEVLKFMEEFEHIANVKFNIPIHIHSMNPVGAQNMRAIIQRNGWREV